MDVVVYVDSGCAYHMEQAKTSIRKRLRRVGIFELTMFLLACGVHYITYRLKGRMPFDSVIDGLYFMAAPSLAVLMMYAAYSLGKDSDVAPRQVVVLTGAYGGLLCGYPALMGLYWFFYHGMPLDMILSIPMFWLLLRGWLSWRLMSGALRFLRAVKAEAATAATPAPSGN